MEEIRLQKYISDCGLMSRRAAEKEILAGNIKVNGECVELGRKIVPERDVVTYRGRKIRNNIKHKTYIMLNKPRGYVTTMNDERERRCVRELVSDADERVYPVGRLDMNSEGLLLMTNDGELTNKLTHPSHDVAKLYLVRIGGKLTAELLEEFCSPMELDGYVIQPVKAEVMSSDDNSTLLRVELHEGRNRQIRKMCEMLGLSVLSLKRVAEGKLLLGKLPVGKWRYLTKEEREYLRSL